MEWKITNESRNSVEEYIQRCAWRLVRSAEDRLGAGNGKEKFNWAVFALQKEIPSIALNAEDYIRAAFVNFKAEQKAVSY